MYRRLPISACLVIHNEEKLIERALKSLDGLVGEILVVHDGKCTDNSLAICGKYGAKIFQRKFQGIAEPHRAWLYGKTKYTWILQLDADEFLSASLKRSLPKLIADQAVACYEFIWPYWNGEKYTTNNWPFKKALFRKDRIQFVSFPHAEVLPQGKTVRTRYVLEHRPNYDNYTFKVFRTKWRRWTKIHATFVRRDASTLEHYPHSAATLTPKYYIITKAPYLLALPLACYQGLHALLDGGYKAGRRGLKGCFFIFLYYFFLSVEVGKIKHYAIDS